MPSAQEGVEGASMRVQVIGHGIPGGVDRSEARRELHTKEEIHGGGKELQGVRGHKDISGHVHGRNEDIGHLTTIR